MKKVLLGFILAVLIAFPVYAGPPMYATDPSSVVSDTAYNQAAWDAITGIAPSKHAVEAYLETRIPAGTDGAYGIIVPNNTTRTPAASTNELYPEANVWKANQNGTESSVAIGPTAGQVSFTGPTQARAYALPDAAATIHTNSGAIAVNGGTNILYYCNGGTNVGLLGRGNGGPCIGGAWVATSLSID